MSYKKEISIAVGTLAVAIGIGFVMQHSNIGTTRSSNVDALADPYAEVALPSVLDVQEIELTSASETSSLPLPAADTEIKLITAALADTFVSPD